MLSVEIRVKGQIDEDWGSWLGDLAVCHTPQGESILQGHVLDQAALYGLLSRLRDLGLPLVAVRSQEVVGDQ